MNELQVMNCNASVKPIAFHFTWLGMVFVGHSVREMCLCSMGLKCGSDSLPCAVQTLSVIWKRFEKIVVLQDGFECHVVVISCFHSTEWHGLFTYGWAADVPFTWVSLLARVDRLLFETTAEGQSCKKKQPALKSKSSHIWNINGSIEVVIRGFISTEYFLIRRSPWFEAREFLATWLLQLWCSVHCFWRHFLSLGLYTRVVLPICMVEGRLSRLNNARCES